MLTHSTVLANNPPMAGGSFASIIKSTMIGVERHEACKAERIMKTQAMIERARQQQTTFYSKSAEQAKRSILAVLADGKAKQTSEIANAISRQRTSVLKYLRNMESEGSVMRTGSRILFEWSIKKD